LYFSALDNPDGVAAITLSTVGLLRRRKKLSIPAPSQMDKDDTFTEDWACNTKVFKGFLLLLEKNSAVFF
jgi:hypothetical protein